MSVKVTFKKFEENVRKARQYVKNYDKVRWVICELALEVCEFGHGGKISEGVFTLTKFANEIEISPNTLWEWVRTKRAVVDKLPKTVQNKIHTYAYADILDTMKIVDPKSTPKQVYSAFQMVQKIDPGAKKFTRYSKHIKTLLYNVQRPYLMAEAPKDIIEKMIEDLTIVVSMLKKELELRERFKDNKQELKKSKLNLKKELDQRLSV